MRTPVSAISLLGLIACSAAAQLQLDLSWYTIDCGGGYSSGGDFEIEGTIGQPDAGILTGGSFELTGGYWVSLPCRGDADRDGDVDLTDLATVLSQFGEFGADLPGDTDADGDVDLSDLADVLAGFGLTC